MKDQGFDDTTIQSLVGWASLDMVRRYDDHTSEQQLESQLGQFQNAFGNNDENDNNK
jgi:hypothetical protein